MMATNSNGNTGNARKRSVSRISGPSSPREKPARTPIQVPKVKDRTMAATPTASDSRPRQPARGQTCRGPGCPSPAGGPQTCPGFWPCSPEIVDQRRERQARAVPQLRSATNTAAPPNAPLWRQNCRQTSLAREWCRARAASASVIANPGVEHAVQQVCQEIEDDDQHREDERYRLHRGDVGALDSADE